MCSLINTSLVSLESGLFYEKGKPEGGGFYGYIAAVLQHHAKELVLI